MNVVHISSFVTIAISELLFSFYWPTIIMQYFMSRVSVVDCQVKSSQAKLGLVFKTKAKDAIIVQGPLKQMDGT